MTRTYSPIVLIASVTLPISAQLPNTNQKDADFLGVWRSGAIAASEKGRAPNCRASRNPSMTVIVYCKAHRDKKIIEAIDVILKAELP